MVLTVVTVKSQRKPAENAAWNLQAKSWNVLKAELDSFGIPKNQDSCKVENYEFGLDLVANVPMWNILQVGGQRSEL